MFSPCRRQRSKGCAFRASLVLVWSTRYRADIVDNPFFHECCGWFPLRIRRCRSVWFVQAERPFLCFRREGLSADILGWLTRMPLF